LKVKILIVCLFIILGGVCMKIDKLLIERIKSYYFSFIARKVAAVKTIDQHFRTHLSPKSAPSTTQQAPWTSVPLEGATLERIGAG